MRQSSWSLGIATLALIGLAVVGGTTVGGSRAVDFAISGILALGASLYVLVVLASRQRAWRRLVPVRTETQPSRVAGRRVF